MSPADLFAQAWNGEGVAYVLGVAGEEESRVPRSGSDLADAYVGVVSPRGTRVRGPRRRLHDLAICTTRAKRLPTGFPRQRRHRRRASRLAKAVTVD